MADIIVGPERLDGGSQIKLPLFDEWHRPSIFLEQGKRWNDEGVEMRNSGNVPGAAGQGACVEAARVVDKIGDDNFDELKGEPGGGGRWCRRGLQKRTPCVHPPDQ